jgi:DNA repair protein RadC
VSSDDNLHHKQRLRARYERRGLQGFHDYEVLELMLAYAQVRRDTKPLAKRLIERFGSLTAVIAAPLCLLVEGGGRGAAQRPAHQAFKDVRDFHLRENILGQDAVTGSQDVVDYLRRYYKGRVVEEFKVLYLNAQNVILDEETLAQGTVSEAKVYLRAVVRARPAAPRGSVIVAHNHPGAAAALFRRLALTRRLREALALLDIIT